MPEPIITLIDRPDAATRAAILAPLVRFNEARAGRSEDYRPLAILISHPEAGEVLGGLWGATKFDYLHIDLLFVPELMRGRGLGRQIMTLAEEEALRRGCRGAWLDTYDFQAPGFYERLSYAVFGTIADHPSGHSRIFLKKTFPHPGAATRV
jgi:GNAT superfamily N-acetyltransferase